MSFGRNPHVAKAQLAEQKAGEAKDEHARVHSWREAGRLWERAAEREPEAKRRVIYETNAARARARADTPHDGAPTSAHDVDAGDRDDETGEAVN